MPTQDGQFFCDEFLSEVIGIARLDRLNIIIDHGESDVNERVWVEIDLTSPGFPGDITRTYKGKGKTMGFALAACREHVREDFGR